LIDSLEEMLPEDLIKLDKEYMVTLRNEQSTPSHYESSYMSNIRQNFRREVGTKGDLNPYL